MDRIDELEKRFPALMKELKGKPIVVKATEEGLEVVGTGDGTETTVVRHDANEDDISLQTEIGSSQENDKLPTTLGTFSTQRSTSSTALDEGIRDPNRKQERVSTGTQLKEATKKHRGYEPDVFDFLGRTETIEEAVEILEFLRANKQLSESEFAKILAKIKHEGLRAVAAKRETSFYWK